MRRLVLAAAAAALLLAGCGAAEVQLSPAEAVLRAQSATADASSYRVWLTGGTKVAGGDAVGFQANGAVDDEARRARMSMTIDGVGRMDVVLDDVVVYMRMPAPARQSSRLGPWLELDLRALGEEAGVGLAELLELGRRHDPARSLEQLGAAEDVQALGGEAVRGVETTRYRTTIDLVEYARQLERDVPAAGKAVRRAIRLTGLRRVPMEVWVDGDGLVRRLKWTQRVERASTTMIMELYDFGAEVEVALPPPDQVTTVDELARRGS